MVATTAPCRRSRRRPATRLAPLTTPSPHCRGRKTPTDCDTAAAAAATTTTPTSPRPIHPWARSTATDRRVPCTVHDAVRSLADLLEDLEAASVGSIGEDGEVEAPADI